MLQFRSHYNLLHARINTAGFLKSGPLTAKPVQQITSHTFANSSDSQNLAFKMPKITFKVPRIPAPSFQTAPASDRSSTWHLIEQIGPSPAKLGLPPPGDAESKVLSAFGASPDSLLDPRRPLMPPFQFHSTFNSDPLYVEQPRLLVLKMITTSWCELQRFYDVYAGLPPIKANLYLQRGKDYHKKLEDEAHKPVDEKPLQVTVNQLLNMLPEEERELMVSPKEYSHLAINWMTHTVGRILDLSKIGVAREVVMHGFLDLANGKILRAGDETLASVLVNGIADIVLLKRLGTERDVEDEDNSQTDAENVQILASFPLDSHSSLPVSDWGVVDLDAEFLQAKIKFDDLLKDYGVEIRDIKTRTGRNIPRQQLVVLGAKVQCMYYAQFLDELTKSDKGALQSILSNCERRNVLVDQALGLATAIELLVIHFPLMIRDCVELATEGKFTCFYASADSENKYEPFDFSRFISQTDFTELVAQTYPDHPEYTDYDISALFQPWKSPLTMRYFAVRAAQAFHLLEKLVPISVGIEYHQPSKDAIIARKLYKFDKNILEEEAHSAASFWGGTRAPQETQDKGMCNSCEYRHRCTAINSQGDSVGTFVMSLQEPRPKSIEDENSVEIGNLFLQEPAKEDSSWPQKSRPNN